LLCETLVGGVTGAIAARQLSEQVDGNQNCAVDVGAGMPGSLAGAEGLAGVELVDVTELIKVAEEGASTTAGSTANTLNSNTIDAGTPNSHVMSKRMLCVSFVCDMTRRCLTIRMFRARPSRRLNKGEISAIAKLERKKLHRDCQNCRLARSLRSTHEPLGSFGGTNFEAVRRKP
jgi:hypothetical protein